MTLAFLLITIVMFSVPADSASPVLASGDLDGDGRAEEYALVDNVLTVNEGGRLLWTSPQEWSIDGFSLGDADNDGTVNLVFSLWKKGSFGEIKPFWHKGEDLSYKNHLFVYKLVGDTPRPVWCSSDLSRPILSFDIKDDDGDGLNELIVEEGRYKKVSGKRYKADPDGDARITVWQWEEWGFTLI